MNILQKRKYPDFIDPSSKNKAKKKENCALFRSCTTHTKKRSKYVKLGYGTLDLLKEFFLSHL